MPASERRCCRKRTKRVAESTVTRAMAHVSSKLTGLGSVEDNPVSAQGRKSSAAPICGLDRVRCRMTMDYSDARANKSPSRRRRVELDEAAAGAAIGGERNHFVTIVPDPANAVTRQRTCHRQHASE